MPLAEGQLRRRRDRLGDFLDAWGDLTIDDAGESAGRRRLEFVLHAPGHDLADEIVVRYREYYGRTRVGDWLLAKYAYEYLDIARKRRLAFHMHPISSRPLMPHAHCEDADGLADDEGRHHLRAVELDLREAHETFMRLYASEAGPDCDSYLPLVVNRAIDD